MKDKITNIAGLVFGISTAIATAAVSLKMPEWVAVASGMIAAISGAVIGYYTGKTPDGKKQ